MSRLADGNSNMNMTEWDVRDVEEGTKEHEDRKTRLGNASLIIIFKSKLKDMILMLKIL